MGKIMKMYGGNGNLSEMAKVRRLKDRCRRNAYDYRARQMLKEITGETVSMLLSPPRKTREMEREKDRRRMANTYPHLFNEGKVGLRDV